MTSPQYSPDPATRYHALQPILEVLDAEPESALNERAVDLVLRRLAILAPIPLARRLG